jgi:hypothetical protein
LIILEQFVKRRFIKQRKTTYVKHGLICNYTIVRNDIEGRRGQTPPRFGNFAIRHKAFVQYITIFFTFRPLPLEIKGVIGRQSTRTVYDLGGESRLNNTSPVSVRTLYLP